MGKGVFRKYCKENNIKMVLKDRDGKFSNGIVERFNRTLIGYIKRYKTEFPKQGYKSNCKSLYIY